MLAVEGDLIRAHLCTRYIVLLKLLCDPGGLVSGCSSSVIIGLKLPKRQETPGNAVERAGLP